MFKYYFMAVIGVYLIKVYKSYYLYSLKIDFVPYCKEFYQ